MTHSVKFNFKKANFEAISRHFDSIDWDDVLGPLDAENSYSLFIGEYHKACESFVPLRKPKRSNDPVWINKKIKTLAKEQRRPWFKFKSVANKNVSGI